MEKGRQQFSLFSTSIYRLESGQYIRQRENTDMLGEAGRKSVSSQLSHELLHQMYFVTHTRLPNGIQTVRNMVNAQRWARVELASRTKDDRQAVFSSSNKPSCKHNSSDSCFISQLGCRRSKGTLMVLK